MLVSAGRFIQPSHLGFIGTHQNTYSTDVGAQQQIINQDSNQRATLRRQQFVERVALERNAVESLAQKLDANPSANRSPINFGTEDPVYVNDLIGFHYRELTEGGLFPEYKTFPSTEMRDEFLMSAMSEANPSNNTNDMNAFDPRGTATDIVLAPYLRKYQSFDDFVQDMKAHGVSVFSENTPNPTEITVDDILHHNPEFANALAQNPKLAQHIRSLSTAAAQSDDTVDYADTSIDYSDDDDDDDDFDDDDFDEANFDDESFDDEEDFDDDYDNDDDDDEHLDNEQSGEQNKQTTAPDDGFPFHLFEKNAQHSTIAETKPSDDELRQFIEENRHEEKGYFAFLMRDHTARLIENAQRAWDSAFVEPLLPHSKKTAIFEPSYGGVGATTSLMMTTMWARANGWLVCHVPNVAHLIGRGGASYNITPSRRSPDMWDLNGTASELIQHQLDAHKHLLDNLPIRRSFKLGGRESETFLRHNKKFLSADDASKPEFIAARAEEQSLADLLEFALKSPDHQSLACDVLHQYRLELDRVQDVPVLIAMDNLNTVSSHSNFVDPNTVTLDSFDAMRGNLKNYLRPEQFSLYQTFIPGFLTPSLSNGILVGALTNSHAYPKKELARVKRQIAKENPNVFVPVSEYTREEFSEMYTHYVQLCSRTFKTESQLLRLQKGSIDRAYALTGASPRELLRYRDSLL